MDVSITLIVTMLSWVYAQVQTYQVVYIKYTYVQFFAYELYLNKAIKNKIKCVYKKRRNLST